MGRATKNSANKVVRRLAPMALVATLCLSVAACGSTTKVSPNNAPAVTTPGAATTVPAPTTTGPQSGGAGF